MSEQSRDYAVGYGKPPIENRFQKGQSGNPGGRPRRTKTLVALLGEALSLRSGFPKPDGSWMTQAEAIFAGLVGQASGSDLKAKRLLFLMCWSNFSGRISAGRTTVCRKSSSTMPKATRVRRVAPKSTGLANRLAGRPRLRPSPRPQPLRSRPSGERRLDRHAPALWRASTHSLDGRVTPGHDEGRGDKI
jgi:hypothetical protein